MKDKEQFSMAELREWLAERGAPRSRAELSRRARAGQFGSKIGTQWVITLSEATTLLDHLRSEGV